MASGTMWRSAVTANAVYCSTCTATPPSRRSSDCKCETQLESVQLQAHDRGVLAVSYGPAGDEERNGIFNYVFDAMPSVEEVEEASSDLQNAFRLGYLTPPLPAPCEVAQAAPEAPSCTVVWEAIHEFQHNPEAWDIVKSLASDKGIWDAAMANEKVKAYCRKFSAHTSEGTTSEGAANGAKEEKAKDPRKNASFFSQLYWFTKQAFDNFIARFQKFMAKLSKTSDEEGPGMSDDGKNSFPDKKGPGMSNDGKSTSFFDRVVRAFTRLAVLILYLVTFKRASDYKRQD